MGDHIANRSDSLARREPRPWTFSTGYWDTDYGYVSLDVANVNSRRFRNPSARYRHCRCNYLSFVSDSQSSGRLSDRTICLAGKSKLYLSNSRCFFYFHCLRNTEGRVSNNEKIPDPVAIKCVSSRKSSPIDLYSEGGRK